MDIEELFAVSLVPKVQLFHLLPRPSRSPQELQARSHTGIVCEASDRHRTPHSLPAQTIDQFGEHLFEGDAVKGVAGLGHEGVG